MSCTIIIVPGYTNSGPEHWQSILEMKYKNIVRVEQADWDNPVREEWIDGLSRAIDAIYGDIFLVGHSCGAVTIAQWAEGHASSKIVGALLVAPADIESPSAPNKILVQAPLPKARLPFKNTIVYSDNDEYLSTERAKYFAEQWGSELIEIKNAGHINTAAGYGEWLYGENLVETLSGIKLEKKIN